jgi:predicted Ser/Thr protein kinase
MKPTKEFIALQQALAGEYSLERELGRGGMGIVYLAREVQLDRLVAIKVLPNELTARADVKERFLREARMAASLSHPHIVPIHRVSEAGGFVFFVMAYVNGETLGDRLRARGPMPASAATRIFREVAWALSYAHGRGLVHRDIKPDNILIEKESGRALVTDFGIARGAGETATSDSGRVMGTAHFMSPEQGANEELDGRSDLYSLGVVAYLTLSGKLPFDAPTSAMVLAKHLSEPVPSLAERVHGVPRPLATLVHKLLEKRPEARFESGEQLAEALEHVATPSRAKMPMALRLWTQAQDPLTGIYAAWMGVFALGLISEFRVARADKLVLILGLGSVPLVLLGIYHLRKAAEVLAAGYTVRDMRAALRDWQHERRSEISFELERREPAWAAMARMITILFVLGFAVAMLARPDFPIKLPWFLLPVFIGGTLISLAVSIAGGVKFLGRGMRVKAVGVVKSAIWNSRAGEWIAQRLTPVRRSDAANLDYRPTEMALGAAADELFKALPAALRTNISDLPQVVAALEAHASAARAQVGEINALLAMGEATVVINKTPTELTRTRERAEQDLANSVSALETIRLDLLRLHGGATDLRPITTALEDARALGEELARLDRAQREVRDVVLPFELRPSTPT